jgi:ankyrin repeat protein
LIKRTIVEKKLNNIEKKFLLNSYRDENNNSFLNIAVKKNNEKFVKYFLDKNYNPNDQNKEGNTALHLSMLRKNRKIIKLLLDKKADITIKNKEGLTSYDLADKDIRKEFKMENLLVEKQPGKYYY